MKQKPTIRILAKLAGVSFSTVSLALRNHPRIRPAVRERIQQLALEAGYKPDPTVAHLLARLRSNRTTTYQSSLAFLCLDENPEHLMKIPTFHELFTGSQERAAHLGYDVERFLLPSSELPPKRLVSILKARNIRGILIVDTLRNEKFLREFDGIWNNSASVALGVRPTYPRVNFALNDHFATTKQAVEKAFKLGYRRPGLCIPQEVDDWVENRFSGAFEKGLTTVGAKERISSFDFRFDRKKLFTSWVKREKPDVILTLELIIGEWLSAMHLKIPQDMGVIQLDNHGNPAWAGMQQNNKEVGRAAVDLLIGQLHRNEFEVPRFQSGITISSAWTDGPTVRCKAESTKI